MRSRKILIATLFSALGCSLAANGAVVSKHGGHVLVSGGQGFQAIAGNAELAAGGQVLVRPGGLATIAYTGNCTVHVGSGIWFVQEKAPCAPGTTEIDFTGRMNQQPPADPPIDELLGPPG